ncbi:MAG: 4-hydroxybenzoate octaprenyltransferase [Pirellulales bacterium]|nr:4-hydroxybenzoate octaprenyltransferase [Pirellulales bacterium]
MLNRHPFQSLFTRARLLLEMIRFSHTLFALPFALLAAAMAWAAEAQAGEPWPFRWRELVGILVCMVTARSAAMAFNRLADRKLDAANPRTRQRHLPTGALGVPAVVAFTAINSLGFVAGTLLFLPRNPWPLAASAPVLAFLFAYSFTKRFTVLSHFWLGAALMLAPVAAWVAIRAELAWPPVVLGAAVMLWVAGFDVLYACQDVEYDSRARLRSIPAKLGVVRALRVAMLCHAAMVGVLLVLPLVYPAFGAVYLTGVGAIALLLVYEHWLVRPDDLSRVNRAFFHVNAVVSLGLLAVGVVDLFV